MIRSIPHTAKRINSWMLPLLAFSLPVSTSAVTVLALIIVLLWLIEADFRNKWSEITGNKVSLAVLLYLVVYVVGLLWSEDMSTGMEMFEKQWKILMMPIFLTALSASNRERVINFFLAGLVVMMAVTYLAWFDIVHYGGVTPDHPTRKLYHVVYNPMLAFGFYLVMHEVLWGKRSAGWRAGMMVLAVAMALNMFITEGRAGQVAFFVLFAVLLLQYFSKNIAWGIVIAAILLPVLFTSGYKFSPTFHVRVNNAWDEIAHFSSNPNTSIGLRLQFWKNSWEIIREHPLLGVGTCDFKRAYEQVNTVASPNLVATDNPHSQYVLVLCQFGILGFIVLLGIFVTQLWQAVASADSLKRVRLAFPLFFLTIMLSESYLIVFETGFLFSIISAALYKENMSVGQDRRVENREKLQKNSRT